MLGCGTSGAFFIDMLRKVLHINGKGGNFAPQKCRMGFQSIGRRNVEGRLADV